MAVGLALRMADRRPQQLPQCEALVCGNRQAARGTEGLQGAEGCRRRAGTVTRAAALACGIGLPVAFLESHRGAAQDTIDRPISIYAPGQIPGLAQSLQLGSADTRSLTAAPRMGREHRWQ